VTSIRAEVTKLVNQGVNKIIAVGHAGFPVDTKIAREVDGLDIVVGGHTNTFLYTGKQTKRGKCVSVEKKNNNKKHVHMY
jgi:5'-nucleotidase